MTSRKPLLAGVELGGTKCVCLIGTGPDDIRAQISIPTGEDSALTLGHIETTLREWGTKHGAIAALGIASFGPLELDRTSAHYGSISTTSKPGWRNAALVPHLARIFSVPVGFDTDVNAAALAEGRWGAAKRLADFAYVTVGTGVGVGLVVDGRPTYGFGHSELGHIRIVRKAGDSWEGACAFHGDCVEGLASGVAIASRTGVPAHQIAPDSPVWDLVAHALAQLLHTIVLATAPRRILIGGGVPEGRPELLQRVRVQLLQSLNGYLKLDKLLGGIDSYAVPPGLGPRSGPLGALALAADKVS
jgi:fructokinase